MSETEYVRTFDEAEVSRLEAKGYGLAHVVEGFQAGDTFHPLRGPEVPKGQEIDRRHTGRLAKMRADLGLDPAAKTSKQYWLAPGE